MSTWLRRNRWGLLALPFLLVGLGLPHVEDLYGRYYRERPVEALEARPGQPVAYSDAAVSLVSLAKTTAMKTWTGEPVALPPGFSFWHARLLFTIKGPKGLGGCEITLEDQHGRLYASRPSMLSGTGLIDTGCTEEGRSAFEGSAYFLLPPDAQPVAVRIVLGTQLPRYVRLLPH